VDHHFTIEITRRKLERHQKILRREEVWSKVVHHSTIETTQRNPIRNQSSKYLKIFKINQVLLRVPITTTLTILTTKPIIDPELTQLATQLDSLETQLKLPEI
jgi:hypothetical protein